MGRSFVRACGIVTNGVFVFSIACLLGNTSCVQSDFSDEKYRDSPDNQLENIPGDSAWGRGDYSCNEIADCICAEDDECGESEKCIDGICQEDRCGLGPFSSDAPLGLEHYFIRDRELLFAGSDGIHEELLTSKSLGDSKLAVNQKNVLDVSGGNILGKRPEQNVFIKAKDSVVYFGNNEKKIRQIDLGFQPVAVTTGDVDQDGLDEIVALAKDARFVICHGDTGECEEHTLRSGSVGIDVASGDIDGDNYDEVVLLLRAAGEYQIHAFNYNAKQLDQESSVQGPTTQNVQTAIAVADTDGDKTAEIYTIAESGYKDYRADQIITWGMAGGVQRASFFVDSSSRDIVGADLDKNGTDEIVLLHDAGSLTVYRGIGEGKLVSLYSGQLAGDVLKIGAADLDGDSPRARRIDDEPQIVSGELVPLMQVHWPPYPESYSKGGPYVYVGETDSAGEFTTDTISLISTLEVAVGAKWKGVGAEFGNKVYDETRRYKREGYDHYIGHREVLLPDAANFGTRYSVVVVANTCYHSYRYELDDPVGAMGGSGKEFALMVPVGGRTKAWSSHRYNSYARAIGRLPQVDGTFEIGTVEGYPNTPQRSDGSPILEEDMVFENPPLIDAGDAGRGAWWLSARDFTMREEYVLQEVTAIGSGSLGGMRMVGGKGNGKGRGAGIYLGNERLFSGAAPPVPDNPDTPEDEYEAHRYTFRPFVYTERYDTGKSAGSYYVLSYTVGR